MPENPASEAGPAIELIGVRKSFNAAVAPAVDGISLSIAPGEFLAIIGGSGSGKTTTLKMINRLIEPDAGEVRVEGKPVREHDAAILRRSIGYVIQGVGLFPHLTIAENVAITPRLLQWSEADIDARVRELLELVELPHNEFAHRAPSELSGGQRQRVGVARALAAKPHIVLMDEPFGALDPITRDAIGATYRALHERFALTTVLITHDMQEALMLADRIAVMADGAILADGPPHELMRKRADPRVKQFLDMPRRQAQRVRDRLTDAAEQASSNG
jgi:osmoprotectant transport system ATP-binding protein